MFKLHPERYSGPALQRLRDLCVPAFEQHRYALLLDKRERAQLCEPLREAIHGRHLREGGRDVPLLHEELQRAEEKARVAVHDL